MPGFIDRLILYDNEGSYLCVLFRNYMPVKALIHIAQCVFGKLFLKIIATQNEADSIRRLPLSWCAPTNPANLSVIISLIIS
jgi:hypothetical protein